MRTLRKAVGVVVVSLFALSFGISALAQNLTPDLPDDPIGIRTPLVLIHGLCGSPDATWKHDNGFTKYFYESESLKANFKLYYFTYSSGSQNVLVRKILGCSARANPDHTPARIQGLAVALHQALRKSPDIGPNKQIAIVAHSLGGAGREIVVARIT